jgi:hypothetical protein
MAMEAANPELRSFLQTAFMMSCSHAYDVWQYMVSKGYYPLEAAQPDIIGKVVACIRLFLRTSLRFRIILIRIRTQ